MLSSIFLLAINVAAAADLAPIAEALRAGARPISIAWSFGSSGQLRHQIENGAPFDVYLSANEQYARDLERSGHLLKGSVRVYAQGRLGLWSQARALTSLNDLLRPEVRTIALPNPAHAPYGAAAVEMLRRAGLFDKLRPKLVYGENVRQAYEFARTGNADAVITSWTMLQSAAGSTQLPAHLHPAIRQAGGIVANSTNQSAARSFLVYLLSPSGQSILRKGGLDQP